MTHETKERVTFMAASLFDLAEMTESDLPSVVEVVGIDAIRDLMETDHLRYECSYDRMAEEICNYIDWDPMLVMTGWTDEDLSRIGQLVADLVEGESPADDDAAESLVAILTWEGLGLRATMGRSQRESRAVETQSSK